MLIRSIIHWLIFIFLHVSIFILTCHRYGIIPLVWRWSLISMQSIHRHTHTQRLKGKRYWTWNCPTKADCHRGQHTVNSNERFFSLLYAIKMRRRRSKTTVYRVKVLLCWKWFGIFSGFFWREKGRSNGGKVELEMTLYRKIPEQIVSECENCDYTQLLAESHYLIYYIIITIIIIIIFCCIFHHHRSWT